MVPRQLTMKRHLKGNALNRYLGILTRYLHVGRYVPRYLLVRHPGFTEIVPSIMYLDSDC